MFEKAMGFISQLTPKGRAARATETLKANAEKALRMKQEAGPQTNIPEHQTSHGGEGPGAPGNNNDKALRAGATFNPHLKSQPPARPGAPRTHPLPHPEGGARENRRK